MGGSAVHNHPRCAPSFLLWGHRSCRNVAFAASLAMANLEDDIKRRRTDQQRSMLSASAGFSASLARAMVDSSASVGPVLLASAGSAGLSVSLARAMADSSASVEPVLLASSGSAGLSASLVRAMADSSASVEPVPLASAGSAGFSASLVRAMADSSASVEPVSLASAGPMVAQCFASHDAAAFDTAVRAAPPTEEQSATFAGSYKLTSPSGSFVVSLRPGGVFRCANFPADARWCFKAADDAAAPATLAIAWGRHSCYELTVRSDGRVVAVVRSDGRVVKRATPSASAHIRHTIASSAGCEAVGPLPSDLSSHARAAVVVRGGGGPAPARARAPAPAPAPAPARAPALALEPPASWFSRLVGSSG